MSKDLNLSHWPQNVYLSNHAYTSSLLARNSTLATCPYHLTQMTRFWKKYKGLETQVAPRSSADMTGSFRDPPCELVPSTWAPQIYLSPNLGLKNKCEEFFIGHFVFLNLFCRYLSVLSQMDTVSLKDRCISHDELVYAAITNNSLNISAFNYHHHGVL
jgi:hypothetical protein